MAKEKAKSNHKNLAVKLFVIPAAIGGVIAGLASNNFGLGVVVSLFVLVGNWIGYSLAKK